MNQNYLGMLAIRKSQIIHFENLQIFNSECPGLCRHRPGHLLWKITVFTWLHYGWITHPLIYNKVFIFFFAKFCAKYRNASFRINPLRKAGEFGLCLKETNKQKSKNKVFKEHRKEKDRERCIKLTWGSTVWHKIAAPFLNGKRILLSV